MPWILRMLLTIVPLIALVHLISYFALRRALRRLLTADATPPRLLKFLYGWWIALPAVLLLLQLTGLKEIQRALFYGHPLGDWLLVYPFWFGLIFSAEFLPLFLAFEGGWFAIRRFTGNRAKLDRMKAVSLLSMALGLMVYIAVTIYTDTRQETVARKTVSLPSWPAALDGFRIVHISDVQGDNRTGPARIRQYVERINALKPDLVLFTGDLITRGREHVPVAAGALGQIHARYAKIACMGDHDFWTDPALVRDELEKNGFRFLQDTTVILSLKGTPLQITALTEIYRKRTDVEVLQRLATDGMKPGIKILMMHQPTQKLVEAAPELQFDIIAAGHTHGGQVVFWNWLWPLTPGRWENGYWRGFHWLSGTLLSINHGLGLTFAPVRYQAPANIHVIEVQSVQTAQDEK